MGSPGLEATADAARVAGATTLVTDQVKRCAMCFGKLKLEDEDGASECESCGALWVEGT